MLKLYYSLKKNLNPSKPSEHPPSGGKMSEGLGGNIACLFDVRWAIKNKETRKHLEMLGKP